MEHIPEKDLGWVAEELFLLSKKLVFIAVPTYLSSELLKGNINTHLTVKDGLWWRDKIESVLKKFKNIQTQQYTPSRNYLLTYLLTY